MPQRLTDIRINRVSLVDKGANGRVLAVLKQESPMTDPAPGAPTADAPAGVIAWLRKQLGLEVTVAKGPRTFSEIVAGQELQDALRDNWYTLEDALWSAIYATDADGQAVSMEGKQALVAQNLDEFKAYLLEQMASVVAKAQDTPIDLAKRRLAAAVEVAKVGKKISGSRLERLQSAAVALTSVLDEVAEVVIEEAEEAEEVPVTKEELIEAITTVVTKAQEPVLTRLDEIEKRQDAIAKGEPKPGDGDGEPDDETLTIDQRLDTIEKVLLEGVESRGVRKSISGQDGAGAERVKKGVFAGILD